MIKHISAILLSIALSGCVGYSMHSMHDVSVEVTDYKTNKPHSNLEVSVKYDYDSYGWFYFANTPDPVSGITDHNGKVILPIADYRYRIIMRVSGQPTGELDKILVRKGGRLVVPPRIPVYAVELKPL